MLSGVLSRLDRQRVLVMGDLMLDRYTVGSVRRVSPEAPVTILQVEREESRPGGAGNAILNLLSLGQEVVVVGRTGADVEGESIVKQLRQEGADLGGLFIQSDYQTPLKNRLVAANQQIIRVDRELPQPFTPSLQAELIDRFPHLLQGVSVIAISDYGKGFLTDSLLKQAIAIAQQRQIPVVVDPKGRDFSRYAGSTLIKPNLTEAIEASGLHHAELDQVAERLFSLSPVQHLMITRSEQGISLFNRDGTRRDFASRIQEVRDVTGAGDTVLAVVTAGVANGLLLEEAAELANAAGAISVRQMGCARVSLSDLARELLRIDGAHKVFNDDHLLVLKQALSQSNYTLIQLCEGEGLSLRLLRLLRELKGMDVVVYVEGGAAQSEFIAALASLIEINFILLQPQCVLRLTETSPPSRVIDLR